MIIELDGNRAFGVTIYRGYFVTIYNANKTQNKLSSYQITNINEVEPLEKLMVFSDTSTSQMREMEMSVRYEVYDSLKALEQAADLIIIGAPIHSFDERDQNSAYYSDGTLQDFYTLSQVGIFKIIKQPAEWADAKQMEIVEPVSIITEPDGIKTKVKAAGYNEMASQQKYIIFLKKNSMGQYAILNMNNGKFEIKGSKHPDLQTGGDQPAEIRQKLWEEINSKYEFEYGF
ncbi:hypothetical protein [Paenibacillus sp. Leaf72]|uniref:hypothetical protein n=1 Tax=Paenibacillus sp. Leaf72 TaxID=1736234 RepID=UPI0006F8BA9E|nr:hypothetical protein [Paenibacillus sp. Leaf72]KQO10934.1 hypothetical protein ASF12_11205 [Paenibacillus sp. Leaf72]